MMKFDIAHVIGLAQLVASAVAGLSAIGVVHMDPNLLAWLVACTAGGSGLHKAIGSPT